VRETFHQLYYLVMMRINEMIQNVAADFLENDLFLSLNLYGELMKDLDIQVTTGWFGS